LYKTLQVLGSLSAHHQQLATVHSALAYVIHVWWQLACRIRMEHQLTPDDGQRNCPKHVEFCAQMDLEMSASIGFIEK